jgi:hypothetical protein
MVRGDPWKCAQMADSHQLETEPEPLTITAPFRYEVQIGVVQEKEPLPHRPFRHVGSKIASDP